jgi:RNA polymerase sigma factor (sigma-70 family)
MTVEEYNECVELYADGLYRFVLKNMKDSDKSKDVVQETYIKLWEKVSDVPATNAKSYMFTTAFRTMVDVWRREKRITSLDEADQDILFSEKPYSGLKEALNIALERLPEMQRVVITLRDYEGYSYEEIGKITGLNESQVKVYIFRARKTLKEYIGTIENIV